MGAKQFDIGGTTGGKTKITNADKKKVMGNLSREDSMKLAAAFKSSGADVNNPEVANQIIDAFVGDKVGKTVAGATSLDSVVKEIKKEVVKEPVVEETNSVFKKRTDPFKEEFKVDKITNDWKAEIDAAMRKNENDMLEAVGRQQIQTSRDIGKRRKQALKSGMSPHQLAISEMQNIMGAQHGATALYQQNQKNRMDLMNSFYGQTQNIYGVDATADKSLFGQQYAANQGLQGALASARAGLFGKAMDNGIMPEQYGDMMGAFGMTNNQPVQQGPTDPLHDRYYDPSAGWGSPNK